MGRIEIEFGNGRDTLELTKIIILQRLSMPFLFGQLTSAVAATVLASVFFIITITITDGPSHHPRLGGAEDEEAGEVLVAEQAQLLEDGGERAEAGRAQRIVDVEAEDVHDDGEQLVERLLLLLRRRLILSVRFRRVRLDLLFLFLLLVHLLLLPLGTEVLANVVDHLGGGASHQIGARLRGRRLAVQRPEDVEGALAEAATGAGDQPAGVVAEGAQQRGLRVAVEHRQDAIDDAIQQGQLAQEGPLRR